MTEKLYYVDAYIKEFSANVVSVEECGDYYLVVLDKTAFFPEEGGQYSDTGFIDGVRVVDVFLRDGVIYHKLTSSVEVGANVSCTIDFDERYEKMQCHSAEHILSGLFFKHFGVKNVGFHLGKEDITMDISSPLDKGDLFRIEEIANRIVAENVEIISYFPTKEELLTLEYRSKLEIENDLRIVKIGEYDTCACCAPHVNRTGEIGIIKILDFEKLRGGMRIHITAGKRAYRIVKGMYENLARISHALSVPRLNTADAVDKIVEDLAELRFLYKGTREQYFKKIAEEIEEKEGSLVAFYQGATMDELRIIANESGAKIGGYLVLLTGEENNYKYIIYSSSGGLKGEIKKINTTLCGKGGGNDIMAQGSFSTSLYAIKEYFT